MAPRYIATAPGAIKLQNGFRTKAVYSPTDVFGLIQLSDLTCGIVLFPTLPSFIVHCENVWNLYRMIGAACVYNDQEGHMARVRVMVIKHLPNLKAPQMRRYMLQRDPHDVKDKDAQIPISVIEKFQQTEQIPVDDTLIKAKKNCKFCKDSPRL